MKILFITPYPLGEAPSQRFRFEQYFEILTKHGFAYSVQSFLSQKNWRIFFSRGSFLPKAFAISKGFSKRFSILFSVHHYDFIFIHREATPLGPPIIEWLIGKVLRRKIIYDFDDAIWLTDRKRESYLLRALKSRNKVATICSMAYKVSCGNNYLGSYAKLYNSSVILNPTTVDTEYLHNPDRFKKGKGNKVIIGWTGSYSTLKYLTELERPFQELEKKYSFVEFWIIADRLPELKLQNMVFKPWGLDSEIVDLSQFDIGVMPLPDDEWANGKCGFKAIQYMAMQIPTVASPVGVNKEIIKSGETGFLCISQSEWTEKLELLIENKALRDSIGRSGRERIIKNYSVICNETNFLSLFQ